MIPDVQRSAIAITTFPMSFFQSPACVLFEPAAEIMTPHTRIPPKQTRRITVVIILVNHHISLGNAVVSVTVVPSVFEPSVHVLIQFPINGTLVLSLTPQQTPGALQLSHLSTLLEELSRWNDHLGVLASQSFLACSSLLRPDVCVSAGVVGLSVIAFQFALAAGGVALAVGRQRWHNRLDEHHFWPYRVSSNPSGQWPSGGVSQVYLWGSLAGREIFCAWHSSVWANVWLHINQKTTSKRARLQSLNTFVRWGLVNIHDLPK